MPDAAPPIEKDDLMQNYLSVSPALLPDNPPQHLDILWIPVQDGVRILQVYGEHPHLVLPESIHERPVTEIGPYCFSRSVPRLPEQYFHAAFPEKAENPSATLTALNGDAIEQIVLPASVHTLHNAAFYNCRKLHTLWTGNHIRSIGSDEFTNCSHLHQLYFYTDNADASSLSLLLERVTDDLNVTVLAGENGQTTLRSALFFPEYYEWLDEISPAHIFSRSIHGEGFRMRKCFTQGHLDYDKYDACLENALKSESAQSLCQISLNRLRWPEGLKEERKFFYEQTVKNHLSEALTLAVREKDRTLLLFLSRQFMEDKDYTDGLALCQQADWGEGCALLMEAKPKQSFQKKTFTFDHW